MADYVENTPLYVEKIRKLKDLLITNIVLIGQVPAPTFKEHERSELFLDRLSELQVDECTFDDCRNPIGVIRGRSPSRPPIFVVAHMDALYDREVDHSFTVEQHTITGAGILENALGVAVLASFPEIFRTLGLRFHSDIVLAGVIQSIGKGNLRGIRHLVKHWPGSVRGAVCLESIEIGRVSYYADGMMRGEIECNISQIDLLDRKFKPNAILIINEVINEMLQIRLPLQPRSRIIIGKISGGSKHGIMASDARLGFEIQSNSDTMVREIFDDIRNIVEGISHEYQVDLTLKIISNISASNLKVSHPLVKTSLDILKTLDVKPIIDSSESELSIFLSHHIPAVTLGITRGKHYLQTHSEMEIEPMFKGIGQIIGVIQAIDNGVCDKGKRDHRQLKRTSDLSSGHWSAE